MDNDIVFVLYTPNDDGGEVRGIFSTREKAESQAKILESCLDSVEILVQKIDETFADNNCFPTKIYQVQINSVGEVIKNENFQRLLNKNQLQYFNTHYGSQPESVGEYTLNNRNAHVIQATSTVSQEVAEKLAWSKYEIFKPLYEEYKKNYKPPKPYDHNKPHIHGFENLPIRCSGVAYDYNFRSITGGSG